LVENAGSTPPNMVTITQEGGSDSMFTPTTGGNYSASSYTDSVLTKQTGVGWTFVRGTDTTMQFNTAGLLTSVTDLNGDYVNYAYNGSSQLTTMTDRAGRTVTFTWTGTHVTSVVDPSSPVRTVTYHYNAAGEMDYFTDVAGSTTSFTYDASHRMLTMRDPRNQGVPTPHDVVNTYDGSGRVATQTDRNGGVTSFDYTTWAGSTIVTNPKGNKTRFGYGSGLLQFKTEGYGTTSAATTKYFYDPTTLGTTTIVDPKGKLTSFTYDSSFNQTGTTDPLSRSTSATFNGRHEPLSATVGGVTTTYTYDSRGNLQTTSTPLTGAAAITQKCSGYASPPSGVQFTQLCYDDASHPGDATSLIDPRGKTTSFHYDTYGNRDQVTDPLANKTTTTYATAGFPLTTTLPRGNVTGCGCTSSHQWVFTNNARGQVLTATDPLGHSETRHYDANGNRDSLQDQNSQTTTYVYDNEDQLTEVHRPDGVVEKTEYWPDGSLKKQIDGATQATQYAYDELGRLQSVTDPDSRVTSFSYDANSNQVGSTDNMGRTVTNTFDDANQLTAVDYSDSTTPDISNVHYDASGRQDSVTQSDGVNSSWTFDSLGRLTASNDSTGAAGYEYDLANNLTKITYPGSFTPGHAVTRAYDDAGEMTSSQDWVGNTTAFGYNEDSALTSTDQPGNQRDNYGVDNANRVMSSDFYSNYGTSTKFASLSYTRDSANNLAGFTQTGLPGAASATYGYNAANKLTTQNSATTWTYDSADNLTRTSDGRTQKFTNGNALCGAAVLTSSTCAAPTADATKYTVDGVGSRLTTTPQTGNSLTFGWDQLRQLRSVTPGALHTATPSGWAHTLTVRADGTVEAFGLNTNGQLGDNTTTDKHTPADVLKSGGRLTDVRVTATGAAHSAAIDNSGALWMWGLNGNGQLGDNTITQRTTATQITALTNVAAVALGGAHSLALTSDGAVWAWGANTKGQLGDNTVTERHTPVAVSGLSSGVVAIATRTSSSYALKSDGTVWAWGNNANGQLGDNSTTERHVPVQVSGITNATAIAAGESSAFALRADHTIAAWGLNTSNQLGDGTVTQRNAPVSVSGISNASLIASGGFHGIALRTDGTVATWGLGSDGQLGNGGTANASTPVTVTALTGKNITTVDAGRSMSLAIGSDGTVYTFGDNTYGQLGNGSVTDATSPTQPADGYGIDQASSPGGANHTLTIRADGTVSASGLNTNGQLGDGTTTQRQTPVLVNGLKNITATATGQYHSVALDSSGNVWTWGSNSNGQLGDGTTTERHLPVRVYGVSGVTAVAAFGYSTYALKSNGTVWAWGQNANGQLGNNSTTDSLVPVQVSGITGTVTAITAGAANGYARTSDGKVWAWGAGGYGQIGDNAFTQRTTAVQVSGITTAAQIAAGLSHAYARLSDGTVKSWGRNNVGQLGDTTTSDRGAPVTVSGLAGLTVTDVAAGGNHGIALLSTGTLKAWGANTWGQIGDNSTTQRNSAVAVSTLTGVASIDAGTLHSTAITTTGDLYAWGYNGYGQLGDNSTTQRLVPTLVRGALDLDNVALATTYAYTSDGLRTSKTIGGVTTAFAWDHTTGAAGLLSETTANATTSYLYGPDGVAYETIDPAGVVTYLHHDPLGSVRAATDIAANIVGSASFDPYGAVAATTGATPAIGWAGQYRDTDTGLVYMRARYYDPDTAQFLTRDPLAASTREAYGYVAGDPLDGVDPSGLKPVVMYDIHSPAFVWQAAEAHLYWKIVAAGGSPVIQPRDFKADYGRIPDLMWSNSTTGTVIAEVKAGTDDPRRFSALARQARADAAIVANGCADVAVWHFYPGRTGTTGPSRQLQSLLEDLGINIVIHKVKQEPQRERSGYKLPSWVPWLAE
jgi:RHS repeat-associated protein